MSPVETVPISEVKARLSHWVREVEAGTEVLITRHGRPVAKLVPYERAGRRPRFGTGLGLIRIHDDFDEPLPEFEPYTS